MTGDRGTGGRGERVQMSAINRRGRDRRQSVQHPQKTLWQPIHPRQPIRNEIAPSLLSLSSSGALVSSAPQNHSADDAAALLPLPSSSHGNRIPVLELRHTNSVVHEVATFTSSGGSHSRTTSYSLISDYGSLFEQNLSREGSSFTQSVSCYPRNE